MEDRKTNMARLKVGLIGGGGPGNFFGGVHKRAISLDGSRELVAGALRSDPDAAMVAAGYRDKLAGLCDLTTKDSEQKWVLN